MITTMMKRTCLTAALALSALVGSGLQTAVAGHVTVASPDGRLMVTVENQQFSVEYDGQQVVLLLPWDFQPVWVISQRT